MTSETDHPRQRTVAELLAEHGETGATGATGRRRRRRETDEGTAAVPPVDRNTTADRPPAPPVEPGNAVPVPGGTVLPQAPPRDTGPGETPRREPRFRDPGLAPRGFRPEPAPVRGAGPATAATPVAPGARPPLDPQRDHPTDQMPRVPTGRRSALDPGLTGPIQQQRGGAGTAVPDRNEPDDEPADAAATAEVPARRWRRGDDAGPATQIAAPDLDDDRPAGPGDDDADRSASDVEDPPVRRLGRAAGVSTGPAWAAVLAQWIVGAIGGAALWVAFRYLWRSFPVVALAAALLVTIGLVLVVRALLRNNDLRTTIFAVLVGLLLTVSPAILVLLGR